MHHHKYSLAELETMIPWEREVYTNLLLAYLQDEERERSKQKNSL
jgi:hypothetical protein